MTTRKIDKVLATDTTIGAAAVVGAWALQEFAGIQMSIIEAGALIVLAQTVGHKIADMLCRDD